MENGNKLENGKWQVSDRDFIIQSQFHDPNDKNEKLWLPGRFCKKWKMEINGKWKNAEVSTFKKNGKWLASESMISSSDPPPLIPLSLSGFVWGGRGN